MNWTKVIVALIVGVVVLCLGVMILSGIFLIIPTVTVVADEPTVVNEPVTEEVEEPVVIVSVPGACGYDYSVMPQGKDEHGNPLADEGITYVGKIEGPAIVQIDSLTAVSIFPGESFDVPEGDIVTWKYIGDDACLRTQYQWFPGKTFIPVDSTQ